MLPHRYPFRLVDRPAADQVRWRLSAGSALLRSGATLPPVLLFELLAQASLVILADTPGEHGDGELETRGYLVGIDHAELHVPGLRLAAGDELLASIERAGAFGRLVRLDGEVWREEECLVSARLSLALEEPRKS